MFHRTPIVIRGLDPRIHHLEKMDGRVKPGNDEEETLGCLKIESGIKDCRLKEARPASTGRDVCGQVKV